MANYRLAFKQSVAKDLRKIPNADVRRILARIESLADDPRPEGAQRLSVQERYRVRQGAYRIVYEIGKEPLVVTVVKVAHRSDAYR